MRIDALAPDLGQAQPVHANENDDRQADQGKRGLEHLRVGHGDQPRRASISFLISPIAFAGFRPFGQVRAQFMIVWQR